MAMTTAANPPQTSQRRQQMKQPIQAIDVWQNPQSPVTSLSLKKDSYANEIYAFWDREGRNVTLGELQEMTTEQLMAISSDMRISVGHISTVLAAERDALAKLTSNQPMAIQKAKRSLSSLSAKKTALKRIGLEAAALVKERNRRANKPKPKRPKIIRTEADLNAFLNAQGKMQYLRRKHLFALILAELGEQRFAELEKEASILAMPEFRDWACSQNVPAEMVEHVMQDNLGDDASRAVEVQP